MGVASYEFVSLVSATMDTPSNPQRQSDTVSSKDSSTAKTVRPWSFRRELMKAVLFLMAAVACFNLAFGIFAFMWAYASGAETRADYYWKYALTISSYSYLQSQKPDTPCLDQTYFKQEFLKSYPSINRCKFAEVKLPPTSWADLVLFRLPELTISFAGDFSRAKDTLARDLDRRCEILAELGTSLQELLKNRVRDDCRPAAFRVEEALGRLTVKVEKDVFHYD
jgi:hypothetical protein